MVARYRAFIHNGRHGYCKSGSYDNLYGDRNDWRLLQLWNGNGHCKPASCRNSNKRNDLRRTISCAHGFRSNQLYLVARHRTFFDNWARRYRIAGNYNDLYRNGLKRRGMLVDRNEHGNYRAFARG
jgi:hypothetical protein